MYISICISKQVEREFCGLSCRRKQLVLAKKLTEDANYHARLSIGSFLRGEVQRRMRSAAVHVAHGLCQAWLKQDGFTRLHGRQISASCWSLGLGASSRPPETPFQY